MSEDAGGGATTAASPPGGLEPDAASGPGRNGSLELVADEVRAALAAQDRRSDALDAKAGQLLGFAGVLVGLGVQVGSWWLAPGLVLAAVAGVLALLAYEPRTAPVIRPDMLAEHYLGLPDAQTLRALTGTRIAMYERANSRTARKARLVSQAVLALAVAVVVLVVGFAAELTAAAVR